MKTISALLLFGMIAAGAATITTDAYAQSNSQRIISIQEIVEEIQSDLNQLLMPVNATDAGEDSTSSAITGFSGVLDSIKGAAESTQQSVSELTSLVGVINGDVNEIKSTLSGQDGTSISENLNFLTNVINRNHVSLSDRLDSLELAMVQMESTLSDIERRLSVTPATPTPNTGTSPTIVSPGSGLTRSTETLNVAAFTYKSTGTKQTVDGNTVYDLAITFSCNRPVSVDRVSTDVSTRLTEVIPHSNPNINTDRNYLTVDGRDLYDSRFEVTSTTYAPLIKVAELNLEPLATGDALRFDSRQHEVRGLIDASTRSSPGFGYTITVTYLGDRNTTCSFNTGSGSPVGALTETGSLALQATITPGSSIIRNFSDRISCNNNPVEITGIQASTVNWQPGFANFAKLNLTILDGSNDSSPDHQIDFANNGTLADGGIDYPIPFSSDLRISGTIPGADSQLLVQIDYNTVRGASCAVAN